MVIKMDAENRFWEYVGKMGYPTSANSLRYGSSEKKVLDELRWFFHMKVIEISGARIGWVTGARLSELAGRYWDANLAFIMVTYGEDAVVEKIRNNIDKYIARLKSHKNTLIDEDILNWIEEGGVVSMEDVLDSLRYSHGDGNRYKCMRNFYENFFGEGMKRKLFAVLDTLQATPRAIQQVKSEFEIAQNMAKKIMDNAEKYLKDLAEKAGIDFEELLDSLL